MIPVAPLLSLALAAGLADAPALSGNDPVRLCRGEEVPGREDLTFTHGRYTYAFADEDSLAEFRADPDRWAIQWGGGCARMGPLSGHGDPNRWTVHREHLFIFASDACRETFRSAPEQYFVPAPSAPTMSEAELATGGRWMARAVEAHGGATALAELHALEFVHESTEAGWKLRVEQAVGRDGSLRRAIEWQPPDPEQSKSVETWRLDETATFDEGEGERELTSPDQVADLRRFAHREPVALLWASRQSGFRAAHRGAGHLGERSTEDVLVWHEGLATTLHLDPESGRILGLSWTGRAQQGATREVVETFTAWTTAGDLVVPTARTVTADGNPVQAFERAWTAVQTVPGRN